MSNHFELLFGVRYMQTSFENTRMVKAWYDEIAQYDFGHLPQVDIPNKKCPEQWIIDMSQFSHENLLIYIYIVHSILSWCLHMLALDVERRCLVGFRGTAQKCLEYLCIVCCKGCAPTHFSTAVFSCVWSKLILTSGFWFLQGGDRQKGTGHFTQVVWKGLKAQVLLKLMIEDV